MFKSVANDGTSTLNMGLSYILRVFYKKYFHQIFDAKPFNKAMLFIVKVYFS